MQSGLPQNHVIARREAAQQEQQQRQIKVRLYAEANTVYVELAYQEWLRQFGREDTSESFALFADAVSGNPQNWQHVQHIYTLSYAEALQRLGVTEWPQLGRQLRPTTLPSSPQTTGEATGASPPKRRVKEIRSEAVKFQMVEFFETEPGQWAFLFFFIILTLIDLITNVWMLTGRLELDDAIASASIWHWLLGFVLVFTEMYFAMARALIKRAGKVEASQRLILYGMLVATIIAVLYDLAATFLPPYNLLAANGDPASIIGGIVLGTLLAVVTTVGSSKLFEQIFICIELRRQARRG